jgi:hypothetical protein
MSRSLLPVLLLACLSGLSGLTSAQNAAAHLPPTSAESISGKTVMLPRDLPGSRTVLLIAFEREQLPVLETWVAGLAQASAKTSWQEIIVVGPQNAFVRAMIERGMRRQFADPGRQDRMFPVFADQQQFSKELALSPAAPHAAVVDRAGNVLGSADGAFSPAKAAALLRLLEPGDPAP